MDNSPPMPAPRSMNPRPTPPDQSPRLICTTLIATIGVSPCSGWGSRYATTANGAARATTLGLWPLGMRDRNSIRPMSLEWEQVVVDAAQPAELGRWWANALGWVVVFEAEDEFEIRPAPDRLPGLVFVPVGDRRLTKNRLHRASARMTKRPR